MELDTNIKKPRSDNSAHSFVNTPSKRRRSVMFSRLARVIFLSNLFGLAILIVGSLALNQYTTELVKARIGNLESQAGLITSIMGETASGYGLNARLDVPRAKEVLARVDLPDGWRVRLHDEAGRLLADSAQLDDSISVAPLDDIPEIETKQPLIYSLTDPVTHFVGSVFHKLPWRAERRDVLRRDMDSDIRAALIDRPMAGERYDMDDNLIVTVSQPVKRVQRILGVVTLESADVQDIIAGERRSLAPFIGMAILAAILSSLAITLSIALPLRHLARAAEIVARSSDKKDNIPDFSARKDEIGDLSIVLQDMTKGLYSRIDDIANFAADVAHEVKNPLTSLRSASDTLRSAKTKAQREKLISIIQDDVSRMDRLISDISKASKVDASLARETSEIIDIHVFLDNISEFYAQTRRGDGAEIIHQKDTDIGAPIYIRAFETPFAQVLRNLIDNALTFSPADGLIVLRAFRDVRQRKSRVIITVQDDGPGIPNDNIETIFERFYTERPKGAQFGSHSGLGLAICRQIVSAHKGTIRAENRENDGEVVGAIFIIDLPEQNP